MYRLKNSVISSLFLLILFMCFSIRPISAKNYIVKDSLKVNVWNDILGDFISKNTYLIYGSNQSLYWCIDYTLTPTVILLKDTTRETLLEYIEKYKKWNRKATQKGVKLEKEIGVLPSTIVSFKLGDDWQSDYSARIHIIFFSQSTKRHQLIIDIDKLVSRDNEYITWKPEKLYLWWDEVVDFEKAINNKAIKKYINYVKKKQSIEEEFK